MTAFQLAGVALAALLSENFILVNCLGIGTRTKAFQDPLDAWRTGVSLTAVMTLCCPGCWTSCSSTLRWATFKPWFLPWWDRLW